MRVFITGGRGQLGYALVRRLPASDVVVGDLPEFDVTDAASAREVIGASGADVVIHCAAYTNVEGCARDPVEAFRVNGLGTQSVALACAEADLPMVLISTNEVFDGAKPTAYEEFDTPNPPNPYGRSKLAAEWYTQHLLKRFYIVRTSWMYSAKGSNFIHRIQKLADEGKQINVVTDELGAPTWAEDLAAAILKLIATQQYGVYHLVNAGYTSRWELARRVLDLTGRALIPIEPIALADFRRESTPPPNGALVNVAAAMLGIELRRWEEALEEFLNKQNRSSMGVKR